MQVNPKISQKSSSQMQRLSCLETVFIISLLAACFASAASAQTTYTITDIGTLPGGTYSYGMGINTSGQVAGYGVTGFSEHAFLYSSGTMTDLGTLPGGTYSYGLGINASGQVTGWSDGTGFGYHAFLYSSGTNADCSPAVVIFQDFSWDCVPIRPSSRFKQFALRTFVFFGGIQNDLRL